MKPNSWIESIDITEVKLNDDVLQNAFSKAKSGEALSGPEFMSLYIQNSKNLTYARQLNERMLQRVQSLLDEVKLLQMDKRNLQIQLSELKSSAENSVSSEDESNGGSLEENTLTNKTQNFFPVECEQSTVKPSLSEEKSAEEPSLPNDQSEVQDDFKPLGQLRRFNCEKVQEKSYSAPQGVLVKGVPFHPNCFYEKRCIESPLELQAMIYPILQQMCINVDTIQSIYRFPRKMINRMTLPIRITFKSGYFRKVFLSRLPLLQNHGVFHKLRITEDFSHALVGYIPMAAELSFQIRMSGNKCRITERDGNLLVKRRKPFENFWTVAATFGPG